MQQQPSSQIILTIECNNLASLDALSQSDPFVLCLEGDKEIGRTERIKNNANPRFVEKIKILYFFEKSQKLTFRIYDSDHKSTDLKKSDLIGEASVSLSEIVSRRGGWTSVVDHPTHGKGNRGSIKVTAEEVSGKPMNFTLKLEGKHLDKKDLFGKSDPYILIYKMSNGQRVKIYESEIIQNTLDPSWREFKLDSQIACGNNLDTEILFECFDWDSNSDPDLIGAFLTTFNQMQTKKSFDLINPKKTSKSGYKNSGELVISHFKIDPLYSFFDYLYGGCEISLMVAIDFTGSNGDPSSSDSLHFRNPAALNEYQKAILSIGQVVEPYDSDRLFPVFGFGGKLADGNVHHDFHCNLNPQNPNVFGVQGIMDAYYSSLNYVQLWGPTNFSPIIKKVTNIVSSIPAEQQKYFILLILTDGEITDTQETIDAIVKASSLPISIIIIGVGDADFSSMEKLDGDKKALRSSSGQTSARDIVQFVPFRKGGRTQENLAAEVLKEVPGQVISYMKSKNLKPIHPPPQ